MAKQDFIAEMIGKKQGRLAELRRNQEFLILED
jgi:hypothetical protein